MYKIIYDPETFGITLRSLKMLRNALAERLRHRIVIVKVRTNDQCCGFLIFDRDANEAAWTGDGFRSDLCGEGGAGMKSAETLFTLYGVHPFDYGDTVNLDWHRHAEEMQRLISSVAAILDNCLGESAWYVLADREPYYVR